MKKKKPRERCRTVMAECMIWDGGGVGGKGKENMPELNWKMYEMHKASRKKNVKIKKNSCFTIQFHI